MRRPAPILLVAGILALAVFLVTRRSDAPRSAFAPETSGKPAETPRESEMAGSTAPQNERAAVAPSEAEAKKPIDTGAGWSVCVVDGRTNAPVAGAIVSVEDSTLSGRELLPRGIGMDTIEGRSIRREHAIETRTGADGCTYIASTPASAMVEARSGTDWAFTVVNQPPPDGRVTLRLGPDRELRVRVVDAAGAPVGGVPVALRRQTDASPTFTWKWTDTDPKSGIATFFHFQRRLEQGTGWQVVFAFPLLDEEGIRVDPLTPPEPPLELVLPETGRLLVRVRAADGRVHELGDAELRIEAFASASSATPIWPNGPWSTPRLDAAGDARVPWLGLGLSLRTKLVSGDSVLAERSIAGPARAGEEVVCDLDWLAGAPYFVTGRLVLGDGRVWPAATVDAWPRVFPTPERWPERREVQVDARGRFRLQVDVARPENGSLALRFSAPHPDGLGEVIAFVPLDREIPPGGLDLGDVLLDFGELLASGRVVDESRQPISRVDVRVSARTIVSDDEFWPRIEAAGLVQSREDGAFALYLPLGEPPVGDELRLSTSAKGYAAEHEIDVGRGERGVELVLARAGAIAGSLVLDGGFAHGEIVLVVSGTSGKHSSMPKDDGTFEVPDLPPGTYSLEVRGAVAEARARGEPAARIEGLVVRAGETCRDPRIQGLRIDGDLATLRIRVLDRASKPIESAAVSIIAGASPRSATSGNDGVCFVRCESLPVDLEVSAFGFARQRLLGVRTERDVVLEEGFPIRLRINARPSGSEPKYGLFAMLYTVDANGAALGLAWGREYDPVFFDERGELRLRMPEAGVYECDVHVSVLRPDHVGSGAPVELSPRPRITVLAGRQEQVFELSVPEEAVRAAVERASR